MMTLEEFRKLTTQIAQNLSDQGRVTDLLSQINEGFETISTTNTTLTEQTGKYEEQISSLQKTNMNLFLKQGNKVEDDKVTSPEPMKYEDLIQSMEGTK